MFRTLTPSTARKPRTWDLLREWEPFELMERFFDEGSGWGVGTRFLPPVDVAETPEAIEVSVELPGMKPEEVHVEMKEGRLYISGEKKEEREEKGKTYHRVERRVGEFHRVLSMPANVDETKVEATFEKGVLKVTLSKTEEAKSKTIPVTAA
ncbi:MAG: Hsp20/alpha crystallin family protein [Pirellulaceae bacterium]